MQREHLRKASKVHGVQRTLTQKSKELPLGKFVREAAKEKSVTHSGPRAVVAIIGAHPITGRLSFVRAGTVIANQRRHPDSEGQAVIVDGKANVLPEVLLRWQRQRCRTRLYCSAYTEYVPQFDSNIFCLTWH